MSQSLFLAIDQGGQSTRVAVFDHQGNSLCCYAAPCETYRQTLGDIEHIEQNAEEILAGIHQCLAHVAEFLGGDVQFIQAAGFAGQGSSLLCWNSKTGVALTPVMSWQDIRGESYLQNLALSQTQVQARTGLRLSPHYGASKIAWCLAHNELVQRAQQEHCLSIGPIVSYVFWHLLNKQSQVDPGHAQRTLLWNLTHNEWDTELLTSFNIPRELLPQCQYHNSHFGKLPIGDHWVPVTAAARDQGASLFARGLPHPTSCYINLGTGAFIQRVSTQLQAPEGLLVSPLWLPQPAEGAVQLYAWEATVNGAASAIPYLQQHTGLAITPEQIEHAFTIHPKPDAYFLNAVGGLSAPYWRTDLQAQFSEHLTPYEKIHAWLESILFQVAVNVELMNALGAAQTLVVSGGFSKSNTLCQRLADLTQITLQRSENSDATLQGIAYLAAAMPASWAPHYSSDIFLPNINEPLMARFAIWKAAMKTWLTTP